MAGAQAMRSSASWQGVIASLTKGEPRPLPPLLVTGAWKGATLPPPTRARPGAELTAGGTEAP
jgi:hypothetical protein